VETRLVFAWREVKLSRLFASNGCCATIFARNTNQSCIFRRSIRMADGLNANQEFFPLMPRAPKFNVQHEVKP
jgi:hypothetical protein